MSRQPQPGCSFALICTICGNHKTFSDLSHTLTHLNSRGHLQQKHKLELQAPSDPAVQTTLDNYNVWYTSNNIAALLSERMNIPKGGAKKTYYTKPKANPVIKAEDAEDAETPAPESAYKPTRPARAVSRYPPPEYDSSPLDSSWAQDDDYAPTRPSQTMQGYLPVYLPIDPMLSSMMNTIGGKPKGGGPLELKGDVLEGMSVFDSATPRTKKGRNQRKGPEVLEQMKKNAAEVESTEISFHANGDYRASRDIFGPPSSEPGSPVEPSPKKRLPYRPAPTTKPSAVIPNKPGNFAVKVGKPQPSKYTFTPGTGRLGARSPVRRPMSMQNHGYGANYLNPDVQSSLHQTGPIANPFNFSSNVMHASRGANPSEDHDYKPAPVRFDVPRSSAAYGLSYGEQGASYGNGFAYQNQDPRGGYMAGGSANPLSSAYPRHERQNDGLPTEEPRYDYQNHGLPSGLSQMNEPNALRGSQAPAPQSMRQVDSYKPHRPSQQRTNSSQPQWPKAGLFRTGNNRADQFPYRAHEGFRSVAGMHGDPYGAKKDYGQHGSGRQFAAPRHPNHDVTHSRLQNALNAKPYQANNSRLRDDAFPGRDRDGKTGTPTPFNLAPSAMQTRSPEQSNTRRSVQSPSHSQYGTEMEPEYYDEQNREYDGERK